MSVEKGKPRLIDTLSELGLVPEGLYGIEGIEGKVSAHVTESDGEIRVILTDEAIIDAEDLRDAFMIEPDNSEDFEGRFGHLRQGDGSKMKRVLSESWLQPMDDDALLDNTLIPSGKMRPGIMSEWMKKSLEIAKKTGHRVVGRLGEGRNEADDMLQVPSHYLLEELPEDIQDIAHPLQEELGSDNVIIVGLANESDAEGMKADTTGRRSLITAILQAKRDIGERFKETEQEKGPTTDDVIANYLRNFSPEDDEGGNGGAPPTTLN